MKRAIIFTMAVAISLGAALAARYVSAPEAPSLSKFVPPGALVYLEARDFSGLLAQWNGSHEKEKWLHSANYEEFSRSRLFLRLKDASEEFSSAAGLPADGQFVSQIAGSQSGVALYDIGKLEFLYITRLDTNRAEQTALLESRGKFETRSAYGAKFYFREDPQSGREVAFATSGGYLILATSSDLMAAALQNLTGGGDNSLEREGWWTQAVSRAGSRGDLRMVLNLEKIVPTPYFRSYWIQKNVSSMKAYTSAVSDLFLSGAEYREERVLVKKPGAASGVLAADTQGVADLTQLIPPGVGSYRVVASPTADASLALIETKLLSPHAGPGVASPIAPQVQITPSDAGGGGDLETRIDRPPLKATTPSVAAEGLKELLKGNSLAASLVVQDTDASKDDGFVRFHTAVALLGSSNWGATSVRAAVTAFAAPPMSASNLGMHWQAKANHQELDGLWTLALTVHGKYLLLSDDPELLEEVSSRLGKTASAAPAELIAGFDHGSEGRRFARLTTALDYQDRGGGDAASRTPEYFSGNLASLSAVVGTVSSEKVVVRDAGEKVQQTVTYKWAD